ncbi:hypothetical protein Zmor_018941 [Zophobas morio]|nr:hypothetical protein Zmor_018941 [Zophobas morio]
MKYVPNKIVFLCFSLVFALTLCDQQHTVNITCRYVSNWGIMSTYTMQMGAHKIKNRCPESATELKWIEVQGTMKILYEDSVKDFQNLGRLDLTMVGLEEIQPGTFKNLSRLQTFYADQNNLPKLKTGTFVNLDMTFLILCKNFISDLEPGTFQNVTVFDFDLDANKLRKIRKGVFQNVYAWILRLENNGISKLERGVFANLGTKSSSGVYLYLSHNCIKRLHPQIFDNEHIYALFLNNNSISNLRPGDLNNLPKLHLLHLSRNRLTQVPEGVFNASKISTLDLSHNRISVIANGALDGMTELRFFEIQHNQLKEWDDGWFRGLSLIKFNASYNYIEVIHAGSFVAFGKDSKVELAHNQIRNISDCAFTGLERLKSLDLSYNEISEWKIDFMKNVVIGDNVDLRGNKINCTDLGLDLQELLDKGFMFDHC